MFLGNVAKGNITSLYTNPMGTSGKTARNINILRGVAAVAVIGLPFEAAALAGTIVAKVVRGIGSGIGFIAGKVASLFAKKDAAAANEAAEATIDESRNLTGVKLEIGTKFDTNSKPEGATDTLAEKMFKLRKGNTITTTEGVTYRVVDREEKLLKTDKGHYYSFADNAELTVRVGNLKAIMTLEVVEQQQQQQQQQQEIV